MNVLVIRATTTKADAVGYGGLEAAKRTIGLACDIRNAGCVAVTEPWQSPMGKKAFSVEFFTMPLFADFPYIVAYLKTHMRWFDTVEVTYLSDVALPVEKAVWTKKDMPRRDELLLLFAAIENKLSPENLTCDGERPRSAVREIERQLLKERAAIVRLLGGEPEFAEYMAIVS